MSRHRFVRNLDLDAELEDEEEEGMTAEQKAQMTTSMPIARALLKDIKPPISDDAIADSLWHYWFDVDKAVQWLRKDWEKKGQPIPSDLSPTPAEKPRRLVNQMKGMSLISNLPPPGESSSPKPISKLALLAQKRREAAQAKDAQALRPNTSGNSEPSPSSPAKPLSKLAQKMAASRAARTQSNGTSSTPASRNEPPATNIEVDMDEAPQSPAELELFSLPQQRPAASRSPFFSLLTTSSRDAGSRPKVTDNIHMHIPAVDDMDDLVKRIGAIFATAESPDDIVLRAREGRAAAKASLPPTPTKAASQPGKPRTQVTGVIKSATQPGTPRGSARSSKASSSGTRTPTTPGPSGLSTAQNDLAGLHLGQEADEAELEREREKFKERAALSMKQEDLIAKVKQEEEASGKRNVSLIVVGHVDAGKSTLMGRLLYDLGELSEKEKTANERGSKRVGKSSFAFAWGLDALGDERDRGVTIDIATTHFATPHRNFTLLDAPGHRDFIPAMISGAAQADVALMVVDGSPGEFEAGFERGGQTREHAWLVRSLGVREIVVGINKMDLVDWSQDRYDEIVEALKPFLVSAGFSASKTTFIPIAAMEGTNVLDSTSEALQSWYSGPTLIQTLDRVEVPERPYASPLRIPVSNVFKGQTAVASGVAVSGRLCSGLIQVGDRVRAVPGDEVGSVRTIEVDDDSAPYAVAGQNVTLYLTGIDPIHLAIGTVLCPTSLPVPLVSRFTAQILVFDLQSPIIAGTAVELFHHSINLPATISKLISLSEKGVVTKRSPRVLQKGAHATVELTLRATSGSTRTPSLPLETAADNKEMGRVLIRRGGETIAAGVVLELLS